MKGTLRMVSVWVVLAIAWGGCGQKREALVVARVGDQEITIGELRAFEVNIPKAFKTEKSGVEGLKDYLQTMIDREFMILEARSQGLDRDESSVRKLETEKREKILERFYRKEIGSEIEVSEEEMRRYFEEEGLGRAVKVRHISVKTEEDARAVLKEIEQGRSFEDMARERSLDQGTAEQGGLLDRFYTKDEAGRAIGEGVFSMEIGQLSEPIPMPRRYEIVQLVEEKPVPFEYWKGRLVGTLRRKKFYDERAALLERLRAAADLKLNKEGVALLLARAATSGTGPQLSEQEREIALYEYKEGHITLGDFVDAASGRRAWRFIGTDPARVTQYAEQKIIPERLLLDAARRAGFYKDKEILAWAKRKEEDLLIQALRKAEVRDKVAISEEEIRAEYEKHKMDLYIMPVEIRLEEVLVGTKEEAERLSEQIKKGADMAELAQQHTLREGYRTAQWQFHVHSSERDLYGGDLVETAERAPIGQLMGPMQVKGGYSIFKVLERKEGGPEVSGIRIIEVLVGTKEEAERLSEQIKEGADMAKLAEQHTLRRHRFHVHPFEKAFYGGDLVETAERAPIGQLMGPMQVKGGYSIFKVLERKERKPEPFEKAKRRVRAKLRRERESRVFNQLTARLRIKYKDQATYFEENLKKAVTEAA